jgi:two-component system LytT family response regulator
MTADRPLSTVIVDDEELARRGIRSRVRRMDGLSIARECENGREAVDAIRACDPDLVFLDVQMPGLDGFDVIDALGPDQMPVVIFVTAYDQYALRAFDAHALDYLLKPLDEERFREAVERARERVAEREAGAFGDRLQALLSEVEGDASDSATESDACPDRFVIKTGGRVTFVDADAICWVEAAGDYVRLHTPEKSHLLRETMSGMEDQLDPDRFLRIHRSTIVNTDCLKELRPYGNSEHIVVLEDGTELKQSRTYRDALSEFFDGAV